MMVSKSPITTRLSGSPSAVPRRFAMQRGSAARCLRSSASSQPIRLAAVVRDPQPDRLNPSSCQPHAEKPLAFAVVQDRCANDELVIALDLFALEEGAFFLSRGVRNAQQAEVEEAHK